MGFFGLFGGSDIDRGVKECRSTPGAVLVDVREADEYAEGRIPGSRHVPLSDLSGISAVAADKDCPLFVYCYSGARSAEAVAELKRMGYRNVKSIGGINRYRGAVEH